MEIEIVLLKVIIYSILGYYLVMISDKLTNNVSLHFCQGVICPSFGVFALLQILNTYNNVLFIFITSIAWYYIIRVISKLICKDLVCSIKSIEFGLIGLLNYYIIEPVLDNFIFFSTYNSFIFLLVVSIIFYLLDIIVSLRMHM